MVKLQLPSLSTGNFADHRSLDSAVKGTEDQVEEEVGL